MMSPDRILLICGAAVFGILTFNFLQPARQPAQTVILPGSPEARRMEAERAKQLEAARKAEQEERARLAAAIKQQQRERNAQMFNQRYNTDRTPVGSIGADAPAQPAPQGFAVVKPALPQGQTGGGFREVKWGKGQ